MQQLGALYPMREGPISTDSDERVFTLDDIVDLFIRSKQKLLRAAFFGVAAAVLLCLLKPVEFEIAATFKEGAEKNGSDGTSLRELFGGFGSIGGEPQAIALMKSYQVLKPLIEKKGLQASVLRSSLPFRTARRILENLAAELGKKIPDIEWFSFQEVSYGDEASLVLQLSFSDPTHFSLYDMRGKRLAKGEVGVPVALDTVSFTISQTPKRLYLKKKYRLEFESWISTVDQFIKKLSIIPSKSNESIYNLAFYCRDRKQGVQLLDQLMIEYQLYLKRDHNQTAAEQIAYLESKQDQVFSKMGQVFDEHADYLKNAIGERGYIAMEQEAESYLEPHEQMRGRLLEIDIELSQLEEKKNIPFMLGKTSFDQKISATLVQVQKYQQQRDMIEISLLPHYIGRGSELKSDELVAVREQKEEIENVLQSIQTQKEWSLPPQFGWARGFTSSLQRGDFTAYLTNQQRLLSVREKVLSDRFSHLGGNRKEFEGLDLKTSRTLYIAYNQQLDAAEVSMRRYAYLKDEIQRRDFELSTLSAILTDPLSADLIGRASKVGLQLKDERYRSSKEEERWSEEIVLEKKILSEHLDQLWKIEELNQTLLREKIRSLQEASLDCLNQEISVLQRQLDDSIGIRKEALIQEKEILNKKMEELRLLASALPKRWARENWLKLKTEMGTKIISVVTELVESKTISHHLHHVESKPLDLATLPTKPLSPRMLVMGILGGVGAVFALFFFLFFRTLLRGFPVTGAKLRALNFPFCGKISSFCDGPYVERVDGSDLETLRQLALFLDKEKVVLMIGGKGPDYSYSFTENLTRTGKRTLLIRADFSPQFSPADRPGLLQWVQSEIEEVPIRRGKGFDFIPSGGFSSFGPEVLQSKKFQELLDFCKQSYSQVLIWLRSPIDSVEVKSVLLYSERAIATVAGETTEELTPLLKWAYHDGKGRLTFISTT
jgi:hypothetical protein